MNTEINNTQDVLDSRDVIARIEELTAERDALQSDVDEAKEELANNPAGEEIALASVIAERETALADWLESDEAEELRILEALAEEGENYAPDWKYGATLIRDSYFVEYVEELLKDIGDLPNDLPGYLVIDWEKTAENIKIDYTSIDFDGVEYWIR